MISDLLLAADIVDAVANPFRTIEEHEVGSARLAILEAHAVRIDVASLDSAATSDIELLSGHIWRWALNEAKHGSSADVRPRLPHQNFVQGLFFSETDRISRLVLAEAVLTHPEAESKFRELDERLEPVPLEQLPDVWPRDYLIQLSRAVEGDTDGGRTEVNLIELGMVLLQIATPAALAALGGTILTLRQMGRDSHPLLRAVQEFISTVEDEDLERRLGFRARRDGST